jgi:putative flavoprotein involved in K+ transport
MAEQFETIVIGAGQSGLAISYYLTQQNHSHIVLEKDRIGEAWRSGKWDSFTLVSPNWTLQLPGFHYSGDDPDGYITRDEVVQYLEDYVRLFNPPVRTGIEVTRVESGPAGFVVRTKQGDFEAANVVVATGAFQKPKIPACAAHIAPHIHQVHSSQYRKPDDLPSGAVLVVGSAQSGCQITEELYRHGRKVYLCTGKAVRIPRRYRGREIFHWVDALGLFDQTVDTLDSPAERFDPNPQLTGKDGGSALNLHQFALDGVTLLGRLQDADGTKLTIAGDLMDNLARADKPETELKPAIDRYIEQNGLQLPPDDSAPPLRAGYDSPIITALDLDEAGITSIVWAAGYQFDFGWINFPIFDEYGYPVHQRGVTAQPGLYFIGLLWLHKSKSNLFFGVGEDAAHVAAHLLERVEAQRL